MIFVAGALFLASLLIVVATINFVVLINLHEILAKFEE